MLISSCSPVKKQKQTYLDNVGNFIQLVPKHPIVLDKSSCCADEDELDEGSLKANNKMLKAKASGHKKDLEALKTKVRCHY